MSYVDGLMLTHRKEREQWAEPYWTAYWCLLIALKNSENRPCQCGCSDTSPTSSPPPQSERDSG